MASIVIYLVSLFILYLSSTLYHSMFAMGDVVVHIFGIFDHCAIYLLIAGSYTPFVRCERTCTPPARPPLSISP